MLAFEYSALIPVHIIPSFLAAPRLSSPQRRTPGPPLRVQILHLYNSLPLRLPHALRQNHHLIPISLVLPQLLPQRRFDPLPYLYIVLSHHTDRMPALARPRRPANSVYIGLRIVGEVEVEDDVDRGYVQTSGRDVRGDEDVSASCAELAQGAQSGRLRQLAMERDGAVAEGAEQDGHSLSFVDGAGENDH